MKLVLKVLFAAIFVAMIYITVRTSLEMSILDAFDTFGDNPWAVATLYDAYCGFITFYVWVAYRETAWTARVLWFVLIMGLGNIATSAYVLLALFRLGEDEPASAVLFRRRA